MPSAPELILEIDQQIFRAHTLHGTFFALFDSGSDVIDLLLESDGQFFEDVYLMYLDAITLSVTRLVDPDTSCGNLNLSFYYLLKRTELASHRLFQEWLAELDEIKKKAAVFKDVRDKQVGHLDLATIQRGQSQLPSFSRTDVETDYAGLTGLLVKIRKEVGLPHMLYNVGVAGFQYGRPLILRLREAKKAMEG